MNAHRPAKLLLLLISLLMVSGTTAGAGDYPVAGDGALVPAEAPAVPPWGESGEGEDERFGPLPGLVELPRAAPARDRVTLSAGKRTKLHPGGPPIRGPPLV